MNLKRACSISLSLLLMGGIVAPLSAFAQSGAIKAAREQIERSTEKIAAPVPTEEQLRDENKKTLLSVIDLTVAELDEALSDEKLGDVITRGDANIVLVAGDLSSRLSVYREYMLLVRSLAEAEEIDRAGVQEIAAALKAWREKVYEPALRQVFDVVLLVQGADVLQTAARRFSRVSIDVKRVYAQRPAIAPQLMSLLDSAREHMTKAARYHEQAKELFFLNHKQLIERRLSGVIGAPSYRELVPSETTRFTCLAPSTQSRCEITFSFGTGHYLLRTSLGKTIHTEPGIIRRIRGTLMQLPRTDATGARAVLFTDQIDAEEASLEGPSNDTVLGYLGRPSQGASASAIFTSAPTVKSLVRSIVEEITLAYKDFAAMSRLVSR